jgi:hypothetical protein
LKRLISSIIVSCLAGSPALAQGSTELWRGLTVGMTKEEYKAKMPSDQVALLPDCTANVIARFPNGKLATIALRPKWVLASNNCIESLRTSLVGKYGQPELGNLEQPGNQFMAPKTFDTFVWVSGSVQVEFRSQREGKDWALIYSLRTADNGPRTIDGL